MSKKQEIKSYNSDGQPHGYWERHYPNGELWYKGTWFNGRSVGYEEYGDGEKKFYLI